MRRLTLLDTAGGRHSVLVAGWRLMKPPFGSGPLSIPIPVFTQTRSDDEHAP
jgi:hypothetical protein